MISCCSMVEVKGSKWPAVQCATCSDKFEANEYVGGAACASDKFLMRLNGVLSVKRVCYGNMVYIKIGTIQRRLAWPLRKT